MTDTLRSRWWYGQAATVILFTLALVFSGVNVVTDGAEWSATATAWLFLSALGIGYLSMLPLYLDVRHVRRQTEYSPRYWLYVLGTLFLSPVLIAAVYLYYRSKATSDFEPPRTTNPAAPADPADDN